MERWFPRWIKDFRYRFSPLVAVRISQTDFRHIPETIEISKHNLESQLRGIFDVLHAALPHVNFARRVKESDRDAVQHALLNHLGFLLTRDKSRVDLAGTGLFVKSGHIKRGQIASIYPGTIYEAGDSILLQSIANHFVLRCQDGVIIDGNDRRLSKMIHRSTNFRDLSPYVSDLTWLTSNPINFLTCGQYINNAPRPELHNVQYIDIDIAGWPFDLRKWFPYSVYNSSSGQSALRVVLLIAVHDIQEGEELLSAYISR